MASFIEFRDVKKIYRMGEVDIKALDGVNFTIEKGEFVVIAGARVQFLIFSAEWTALQAEM